MTITDGRLGEDDSLRGGEFNPRLAVGAPGVLGAFNRAGVLAASDVHVAMRLARIGGDADEQVSLAAALAVRGPRQGHVRVDLLEAPGMAAIDLEGSETPESLTWPEPGKWIARLEVSPLVAVGPDGPPDRPLRLIGSALYLDRYWRDEGAVASELSQRSDAGESPIDETVLQEGLARLFHAPSDTNDPPDDQRRAAEASVRRVLSVVVGGPGTGKTTTVAKVIALLLEQAEAAGRRRPLVALAAPTGKAAARMQEAVRAASAELPLSEQARAYLSNVEATTIHRLLRRRPGNSSRFLHDRYNRLPHDMVIVDETSMVSLPLMARLLEAVRGDARLMLVGDPDQLASVEAGAVMADVVSGLGDRISVLCSNYRFSGSLAALANAVGAGDPDRVIELLRARGDGRVAWLDTPGDAPNETFGSATPRALREAALEFGQDLYRAARAGDTAAALTALPTFRLLCAHRRGPAGVRAWNDQIQAWLTDGIEGFSPEPGWYTGRPVMVTANDYTLRLFNGDTGVVVARPDSHAVAVFDQGGRVASVSPSRLSHVETVFAMTVHKAQGSEFGRVALVLPPADSPLLTRELLYTAITRARDSLLIVGTEESLRVAVGRRVARASGLAERLGG